jgi:hypothetical protein
MMMKKSTSRASPRDLPTLIRACAGARSPPQEDSRSAAGQPNPEKRNPLSPPGWDRPGFLSSFSRIPDHDIQNLLRCVCLLCFFPCPLLLYIIIYLLLFPLSLVRPHRPSLRGGWKVRVREREGQETAYNLMHNVRPSRCLNHL